MNAMVTIPKEEYDRLLYAVEDLADLQSFDRTKAMLVAGEDELIPAEFADRILDGEHPLRVYRDLRGLTQAELAQTSGVNRVYIAAIKALADALAVTVDDLI